jgi:hypothetical protein
MKPKVIEGTVKEMTLNGKDFFLVLDMPRKPKEARMSFPIDSDHKPFLNKKIRMTIEEDKITIEKTEK